MNISFDSVRQGFANINIRELIRSPIVIAVAGIALAIFIGLTLTNLMTLCKSRRPTIIPRNQSTPSLPTPSTASTHTTTSTHTTSSTRTTPSATSTHTTSSTQTTPSTTSTHTPPSGTSAPSIPQPQVNDTRIVPQFMITNQYGDRALNLNQEMMDYMGTGVGAYDHMRLLSQEIRTGGIGWYVEVESGEGTDAGGLTRQYFDFLFRSLKQHASDRRANDFVIQPNARTLIPQSPLSGDPTQTIFYDVGRVMAFAFFNYNRPIIGNIFDQSIYDAMLSLSDDEIDRPFSELSDEKKLAMCEIILNEKIARRGVFHAQRAAINFLKDKTPLTAEALSPEGPNTSVRGFYQAAAYEAGNDPFTTEGDFSAELNIEAILENESGFRNQLLSFLLQNETKETNGMTWTLESSLYPIHTMAKAMKATAGDDWGDIRQCDNLRWQLQGVSNRQAIVDRIRSHSTERVVQDQVRWIREWILDPNTSEDRVENLLTFWTGASSINSDIEVRSKWSGLLPESHTCFRYIEVINQRIPSDTPGGLHNSSYEGYARVLNKMADEYSGQFTMG